jgi:L-alanine-DL-glutamate epimerase-like enolase superfamily enzyme
MILGSAPRTGAAIDGVRARAYRIPTEEPCESDGTLAWDSTTLVYAEIAAAGETGIGYTYGDASAATLINGTLARTLAGADALQTAACNAKLWARVRNDGREGIAAMAVSALDIALWDLKGKLLGAPVCTLLGAARSDAPLYGSGGFTSYDLKQLTGHMARWIDADAIPRVKMKVGREPGEDPKRVAAVRHAIGSTPQLFVDANGAYAVMQALHIAQRFAESEVVWFEEPVYHRDLRGNAAVCARVPTVMEVSNGEYGYAPDDFACLLDAGAADVLQADVTRCGGFTGFAIVDALCETRNVPLSSHCAPYATLHAAIAAKRLRHMEFFYDHVRIEQRFFDGAAPPQNGSLAPDLTRPGIGLTFKSSDASEYQL